MAVKHLKGSQPEDVVKLVNQIGLVKTAVTIGVPQSSLCRWLKRQQYVRKTQYVKEVHPALQTT